MSGNDVIHLGEVRGFNYTLRRSEYDGSLRLHKDTTCIFSAKPGNRGIKTRHYTSNSIPREILPELFRHVEAL